MGLHLEERDPLAHAVQLAHQVRVSPPLLMQVRHEMRNQRPEHLPLVIIHPAQVRHVTTSPFYFRGLRNTWRPTTATRRIPRAQPGLIDRS
jgi:hypothetical protein